ncbi:MAG: translation initiation factor 2 [Peptococcaceae bacterium]|nr:translation initiation factor 2 [Peptococcaceae bacterium]
MENEKVYQLELLPCFGDERRPSPTEQLLQQRVEALEERLEQMKLSRRVLLRLLDRAESNRQVEVGNLRLENQRLKKQNQALANNLWAKNSQIVRLKMGAPD